MNLKLLLSMVFVTLFFIACGGTSSNLSQKKVYGFSFIDAEVITTFDDKVIVNVDSKDIVTGDSYEDILTNKIIKSSLFIMGLKTKVGNYTGTVSDVRGSEVTFDVKGAPYVSGEKIKIYLPKKTIAVMDFSLTGMADKAIEKYAMDDMTTKLVQSGQYIVVEREKLGSILKEQELADSGLLEQSAASKIGKLASADIILTGSFAKQGGKWKVNLRLVDVETGIIISAIKEKISVKEFRPKQSRDVQNITEDFEDDVLSKGWIGNIVNKNGADATMQIDRTDGANKTSSSLKIDTVLEKNSSVTLFVNKRLRDASGFKGIKFYAKSNRYISIALNVHDQNFDNAIVNRWKSIVSIGKGWKEYKLPFNEFVLTRNYARKNPGGDGTFDLDNIESIVFAIGGKPNVKNESIILWLDEVELY